MDVGRCELVLHVRPCEGLMRQLDGTVEKRFAKKEILYPLQVCMCLLTMCTALLARDCHIRTACVAHITHTLQKHSLHVPCTDCVRQVFVHALMHVCVCLHACDCVLWGPLLQH